MSVRILMNLYAIYVAAFDLTALDNVPLRFRPTR
jgi:hypothetical protein